MHPRLILSACLPGLVGLAWGQTRIPPREAPLSEAGIEFAIGALAMGRDPSVPGFGVLSPASLREFYRIRGYAPAWIKSGIPGKQAWQILSAARESRSHGLAPESYHAGALDSLLRLFQRKLFLLQPLPSGADLRLELLLSDAFLTLGDHLLSGCVRPAPLADPWHIRAENFDLPRYLENALEAKADLNESLEGLAPPDPEYGRMRKWLAAYRDMRDAGGWERVPDGPVLSEGAAGARVAALCRRLVAEGLMPKPVRCDTFTPWVSRGVIAFQMRYGLDTTGRIAKADIAQLNVGPDHRLLQIRLNLEICRWLPRDMGNKHIRVNVADYSLAAFAAGEDTLAMKVVVGRREDHTPLFVDRLVGLSLNPAWNVPAPIAREEIFPELRKDSAYLEKHGMELFRTTGGESVPVDPGGIDWRALEEKDFEFRIRQKPGPANPLGKLKFVLTNPFNVYLHDTPATGFFDRNERAFSHGCIRVERPVELALWALGTESEWDRGRLSQEIDSKRQAYLPLGQEIPVYILYRTAFLNRAGDLRFRRDVYGWDGKLGRYFR